MNDDRLSKNIKQDWPVLFFILATLAAGLLLYPRLPDMMPGHWNIKGQIDGWVSKPFGVLFFPLLNLGLYPLMLLLPRIDPRRENYRRFAGVYRLIRLFLHVFLALLYIVTLLAALGYTLRVDAIVKFAVSLLILVLGNYMGKIKHNYFVGIKTPWTLASEEVWYKTHRFAAPLWVGAGILGMAISVFRQVWLNWLYFASLIVIGLVPIIYSYFLFRKTGLN